MKKIAYLLVALALTCSGQAFADNLSPTDDAGVTNGLLANTNYGDLGTMSTSSNALVTNRSYLKFDLTQYSNIESATLYLYNTNLSGSVNVSTYLAANNWDEDTVTWNNKPSLSGTPVVTTVGSHNWYSWNVTSWADLAVGNDFSLGLTSSGSRIFLTSESLLANKPYLCVTGTMVPEPVSTILFITGGSVLLARRMRKVKK